MLSTYHLQGAAQHTDQYVRKPQLVLRAAVVWQLDKVGKGVLVKDERKLLVIAGPVGDRRCDVQEDLKANLCTDEL